MAKRTWTQAELDYLRQEIERNPDSVDEVAKSLSRTRDSIVNKLGELGIKRSELFQARVTVPTKPGRTFEEYLEYQKKAHKQKREYHEGKRKIPVKFDVTGPFGIALFGDLHGDDEGCDFGLFEHHCDIVSKSGLPILSFNLGDFTNNWVGKLAPLWAHQGSTEGEGRKVIQYALQRINWTAVILGNHDVWTPVCEMICNRLGVSAVTHGGKFYVSTPSGQVVLDLAHHHRGNSMYNNAHGQTRKAFRGTDADIIAGAHIHSSAYHLTPNPETGKVYHAVRVSSYKVVDEYADKLGFGDEAISPCVMFICDPSETEAQRRIRYFSDPEDGVIFLRAIRTAS
jgi:hypothetical protein